MNALKTTANKITVVRIILVPVFMLLAYINKPYIAFGVYVIACLSDFLDGYIARHYNQITVFGKFMDPLADKMLVLAAMCYFIEAGKIPGWAVAIVIFREFAVSGLRLIAAQKNIVIAAAKSGKLKTASTMVCLGAMLIFSDYNWVNILSTVIIVATTLYSGIEYFKVNINVLSDEAGEEK